MAQCAGPLARLPRRGHWIPRHYVIRDVVGVRFEVSQDYAFNTDQITFRALLRTDGKRVDLTAVKAYRNGAS
jgi:HK97 family phage major capsid protein